MAAKHGCACVLLVISLALMAPVGADAGPYLGDWTWCWRPGRDCPKGEYCPLHYWAPGIYKVRANVHPSNLDQYPAGPCPPVAATAEITKYPCRTLAPAPTSPYAAPSEYYGRQVINEP